jgi:hypothetical protein
MFFDDGLFAFLFMDLIVTECTDNFLRKENITRPQGHANRK